MWTFWRVIPIVIHSRIFFLPSKGHLCGVALVSITVSFRFGTPSIAGKRKESYSPEPTKNAAQTKQIGLIRKQIRSGCDGKALAPGHDHAILPAGAVDDEDIAHAVVAADDPDVAVIRVKDEIAGQRV